MGHGDDINNRVKERGMLFALLVAIILSLAGFVIAFVIDSWYEVRTPSMSLRFGTAEACYTDANSSCLDLGGIPSRPPVVYFCPAHASERSVRVRMTSIAALCISSACLDALAAVFAVVTLMRRYRPRYPQVLLLLVILSLVCGAAVIALVTDTFASWLFCGTSFCELVAALAVRGPPGSSPVAPECRTSFELSFVIACVALFLKFSSAVLAAIVVSTIVWRRRVAGAIASRNETSRSIVVLGKQPHSTVATSSRRSLPPTAQSSGEAAAGGAAEDDSAEEMAAVTEPFADTTSAESKKSGARKRKKHHNKSTTHSRTQSRELDPAEGQPPTAQPPRLPAGDWFFDVQYALFYDRASRRYYSAERAMYFSVEKQKWIHPTTGQEFPVEEIDRD